jgi:hypothetical protein
MCVVMLDSANGKCVYLCLFAQTGDVFAFPRMQKYTFKRSPVSGSSKHAT